MENNLKLVGALFVIALWAGIIIGWVLNICALINIAMNQGEVNAMLILRSIGVLFAPLGGVLGYI